MTKPNQNSKKLPQSLNDACRELLEGPPPSKGGEWVANLSQKEAKEAVVKSFAGSPKVSGEPVVSWCINQFDFPDWTEKVKTVDFMMSFVFAVAMPKCPLILSKREVGVHEGVVMMVEWDSQKETNMLASWMRNWRYMKALISSMMSKDGLPEVVTNAKFKAQAKQFEKKSNQLDKFHNWHKEFGPQGKHWYIETVAVDPDSQGRGVGKEIMKRVTELADNQGMDCYLEAGSEKNRAFYERFGFRVQATKVLNDECDPSADPLSVYLMSRMTC